MAATRGYTWGIIRQLSHTRTGVSQPRWGTGLRVALQELHTPEKKRDRYSVWRVVSWSPCPHWRQWCTRRHSAAVALFWLVWLEVMLLPPISLSQTEH